MDRKVTINAHDAVNLWLKGKDEWNKWVDENPVADVIFRGTDFRKIREDLSLDEVSFEHFDFPIGLVDFSGCIFGDGVIKFTYINFNDGDVNFSFSEFGNGQKIFFGSTFGNGDKKFEHIYFEDGAVGFGEVDFGDGEISFFNSRFGTSPIFFNDTKFGVGNLSFEEVEIEDGKLEFSNAIFGKGSYSFEKSVFGCNVNFSSIDNAESVISLSFRYSVFSKTLDITKSSFNHIIDLTHTKMSNQVLLDGLKCELKRKRRHSLFYKSVSDDRAVEKLRRLKQISEENKDHHQALYFFSEEMRAKRWVSMSWAASVLDIIYSVVCNYGQSIMRPFLTLTILLSCVTYAIAIDSSKRINGDPSIGEVPWQAAVEFTVINSFPLTANSKQVRLDSFTKLYCARKNAKIANCKAPNWLNLLTIIQGFITLPLVFLIGLGFRNRFRV